MQIRFSDGPVRAVDDDGGRAVIESRTQGATSATSHALHAQGSIALDGHSTWARAYGVTVEVREAYASVWFAPRAFARGDDDGFTALIDATDRSRGFALGHLADGTIAARIACEILVGRGRLTPDTWNHVRLRLDRAGIALGLGDEWELVAAVPPGRLRIPSVITIGCSQKPLPAVGDLPRTCAIGLLASAAITEPPGPLEPPESKIVHGEPVDTTPARERYDLDPHRPIAHLTAPQGWMNEPHAGLQVDGIHHIFYQHNAAGAYWDHISWGHATSTDLVHWRDEPIAVHPGSSAIASDGIWSGSSVLGDAGEHLLFITAGSYARTPDQSVAIARPDGPRWRVDAEPAIEIPRRADGSDLVPGQFRDPFVWREDGAWFALVGAGIEGRGGTALLHTSADGRSWVLVGPLLVGEVSRHPATGVMWELPVLLPVGEGADGRRRHALFVAPWWSGPSAHHLQHVWHWIGVWDAAAARFTPDHLEPREFDGGGHLTGPSGTVLEDGRSILWTIAQDKRAIDDQLASGWAHNAGFPLQLGLSASGSLAVQPITELSLLREERLPVEDRTVRGRHLDIEFAVAGEFELDVCATDDGQERVTLGVGADEVWIDRSRASIVGDYCEPRRSHGRAPASTSRCRLLIDGSMVEFWVNDDAMITSRAYSALSGDLVRLRPSPHSRVLHFDAYRIHPAFRS